MIRLAGPLSEDHGHVLIGIKTEDYHANSADHGTYQTGGAQNRGQSTGRVLEPAQSERLLPFDDLQARIAKRACQLYLERGGDDGYALDDWLQAKREILGRECTA